MNKLDFAAINGALDPDTVVPQWAPGGTRKVNEWVAPNPTRADNTAGSFSINLKTGRWKDFATGDSGKDLVSLYAYIFHDNDQGAAARELAQSHGIRFDADTRQKAAEKVKNIEDAKPQMQLPVPATAPPPKFWHPEHGNPSATWAYRDKNGDVLLYVARYEPKVEGERKQVLPRSWCKHPDGSERWTFKGFTGKDKRPLYGLDKLQANPDADVLMLEGEKTADAGQDLMGDTCVTASWMGGVESADKVSVKPLAGRRVILWPDFDAQRVPLTKDEANAGVDKNSKPLLPMHEQPGIRAMMALAAQLKGVAREVLLVGYDIDLDRAGWDLADAKAEGWTGVQVLEYMGKRAGDPMHIASGKAVTPPAEKPAQAPAAANDNAPKLPLEASVNPFGFPHHSDKMQPMNTVENLDYLLTEYGITARYNETRKHVEVNLPGRTYSVDNRANCSLAELTSICARNRMPQSMLSDYVKLIADRNAYNPVRDWINSRQWDGVTRLQALYDTVTVDGDTAMRDMLIYRWMLSCVAAVFMPRGFEAHGVLVFTGKQGQGKTRWVKRLVPEELDLVLTGAVLDPNNKDTITNAVSHWLVELGELDATFRKADIARLKAWVTNSVDKLRRPYDRIESEYQRRTVCFASVNESKYLVDDTGNRRWWTIAAIFVDYQHTIDVQQVWAELLVHFNRGERWYLTAEEQGQLEDLNAEHEAVDPVEEQMMTAFDWDGGGLFRREMTATEVLLAIGYDKPTKQQATHASKVLKKLTGGEPKKKNSGRYFSLPRMTGTKAARDDVKQQDDTRAY